MNESLPTTAGSGPSNSEIDQSGRTPLLLLFTSSVAWLFLSALLGLIASIKLHGPGFLADSSFLTYGRVQPAATNAFFYGFACQAALGVLLWMICRLGRTLMVQPFYVSVAAIIWNLGVTIGVLGILAGHSSGFERFEFPRYAAGALFLSFMLIAVSALFSYRARKQGELYVSMWYLFAAIFWFAWVYATGAYLLLIESPRGGVQPITNLWVSNGLLNLWLLPVALAIIFYFVPKACGRPLYSSHMALFSFWVFAFVAGWGGFQFSAGIPRWLISLGVVSGVLSLIAVLGNVINWHKTAGGDYSAIRSNPVFRFIFFAAAAYVLSSLLLAFASIRPVQAILGFTLFISAAQALLLYGCIGMALLGAIRYIVERITESERAFSKLAPLGYFPFVIGVALLVGGLGFAGLRQGFALNNPAIEFTQTVRMTIPFIGISTLGLLLIAAGAFAFLVNLFFSVGSVCLRCCPPEYFVAKLEPAQKGSQ